MAAIPLYWYTETTVGGEPAEELPVGFFGPVPTDQLLIIDLATGEIHGEAILMSALPWPRFRRFSDGKKVVLPHREAQALEGLEDIALALLS